MTEQAEQELCFQIRHVIFYNEENCYTVAAASTEQEIPDGVKSKSVTVLGIIPFPETGKLYSAFGQWKCHPKYGMQFVISKECLAKKILPKTKEDLLAFLSSGVIKGIGKSTAGLIVDQFGLQVEEILDHHPERLMEIRGIGEKKVKTISDSWNSTRQIHNLAEFLIPYGVSAGKVVEIFKKWREQALDQIRANPYQLTEIPGFGFRTADEIAQKIGVPEDSPERIDAGIQYAMAQWQQKGNTCAPPWRLMRESEKLLGLPGKPIEAEIQKMCEDGEQYGENGIYVNFGDLYSELMWEAESKAALYLSNVAQTQGFRPQVVTDREIAELEQEAGIRYNPGQRRAIKMAANCQIMILTGGPGTGKTTVLRAVLQVLRKSNTRILLAAPTGRAAKRMKESVGSVCGEGTKVEDPVTIHRLLEYNPERGFQRNGGNKLNGSMLVVDESSMLDIELFEHLVEACPQNMKLLFIGDVDQLPSVGPGSVLSDLIACGRFPVARLTEVTRQAGDSGIVINANRINRGKMPDPDVGNKRFHVFLLKDTEEVDAIAQDAVTRLMTRVLPERGYPVDQIQVLAPMHKGMAGVDLLNRAIKGALHGSAEPVHYLERGGRKILLKFEFEVGDRVMQKRNDYDKEVYNGDIGVICGIKPKPEPGEEPEEEEDGEDVFDEDIYFVRYQDGNDSFRTVKYLKSDLPEQLVPAYACTIHKSQGSEFPVVIIPLLKSASIMLQRNLLYTAVTRAKDRVILIGQEEAIRRAVDTDYTNSRLGHLQQRLEKSIAEISPF